MCSRSREGKGTADSVSVCSSGRLLTCPAHNSVRAGTASTAPSGFLHRTRTRRRRELQEKSNPLQRKIGPSGMTDKMSGPSMADTLTEGIKCDLIVCLGRNSFLPDRIRAASFRDSIDLSDTTSR